MRQLLSSIPHRILYDGLRRLHTRVHPRMRRRVLESALLVVPWVIAAGCSGGTPVGERRASGLRLTPHGRQDASHVMPPTVFADSATRHAYSVATQIPGVLNQLYCWCRCENSGHHRSNLQCFEDRMGEDCDVCQGTAEIAYRMVQQGVRNPAQIQAAVDAE